MDLKVLVKMLMTSIVKKVLVHVQAKVDAGELDTLINEVTDETLEEMIVVE